MEQIVLKKREFNGGIMRVTNLLETIFTTILIPSRRFEYRIVLVSRINSLNTTDSRVESVITGHTGRVLSLLAVVDFLWSKLAARYEVTMRVHDRLRICVWTRIRVYIYLPRENRGGFKNKLEM